MTGNKIRKDPLKEQMDIREGNKILVLHNDDVHTFDYVVKALMEICGHKEEQAHQCATITHFNGSCDIRKGDSSSMKKMKEALMERDLTITME